MTRIASLVIPLRDGKVLLGLKKTGRIGKGTLNGPGGGMEDKDVDPTIVDCAVREALEELGIVLLPEHLKKVAVINFFANGELDMEVHVFRTEVFKGEPHETEYMIPSWHDIDKLPIDSMLESDRAWFPQLIQGETFNANVYYRKLAEGFQDIEFLPFQDKAA